MRLCCLIAVTISIAMPEAVEAIVLEQPTHREKSESLTQVRHEPVRPKPGEPV